MGGNFTLGYGATQPEYAAQSKLAVTNAGNIGIGTTNPTAPLQIANFSNWGNPATSGSTQTGAALRLTSTGTTSMDFGSNGSGVAWIQNVATANLGSNYPLVLNPNGGNVGVGTTSPSSKLHVAGGGYFASSGTANGNYILETKGQVALSGTTYTSLFNYNTNEDTYIRPGKATGSVIMDIGNVGIGTTTPGAKLEVAGATVLGSGVGAKTIGVVSFFSTTNSTANYIHIKTPFRPAVHTAMYHFKVEGFSYGDARDLDLTFVGYSYSPNATMINTQSRDPQSFFSPAQYVGSDGYIYLRFKPPQEYYISFRVDSTYVGNGRIVYPGEMTVTESSAATL